MSSLFRSLFPSVFGSLFQSVFFKLTAALRPSPGRRATVPRPGSVDMRSLNIDAPGVWGAHMIEEVVRSYGEEVARDHERGLIEVAPKGRAHPARIGVSTEPSPSGAVVQIWQRHFDPATLDALQAQLRARFPRVEPRPRRHPLVEQPTLPSIIGAATHASAALRSRPRPCLHGAAP